MEQIFCFFLLKFRQPLKQNAGAKVSLSPSLSLSLSLSKNEF